MGFFAGVEASFLACSPGPVDAMASMAGERIYVVPMAMCDGYLTSMAIPRLLGLGGPDQAPGGEAGRRRLIRCPPIGLNPDLARIIAGCALALGREHGLDPGATRLLLVGHGARNDDASRRATMAQASRLRMRGQFAGVDCAFLEEPPAIKDQLARGDGDCIVIGMFAAGGAHADEDVPRQLRAARLGRRGRIVYAGAIGADPAISVLVLDQIDDADRAVA